MMMTSIWDILIFLIGMLTIDSAWSGCPAEWFTSSRGTCYRAFMTTEMLNGNLYTDLCKAEGGYPASLYSLRDKEIVIKNFPQGGSMLTFMLIGLTDSAQEDTWLWMDGTPVSEYVNMKFKGDIGRMPATDKYVTELHNLQRGVAVIDLVKTQCDVFSLDQPNGGREQNCNVVDPRLDLHDYPCCDLTATPVYRCLCEQGNATAIDIDRLKKDCVVPGTTTVIHETTANGPLSTAEETVTTVPETPMVTKQGNSTNETVATNRLTEMTTVHVNTTALATIIRGTTTNGPLSTTEETVITVPETTTVTYQGNHTNGFVGNSRVTEMTTEEPTTTVPQTTTVTDQSDPTNETVATSRITEMTTEETTTTVPETTTVTDQGSPINETLETSRITEMTTVHVTSTTTLTTPRRPITSSKYHSPLTPSLCRIKRNRDAKSILESLRVEKNSTFLYKSKFVCAKDKRQSSKIIGLTSIMILTFVFSSLVVIDIRYQVGDKEKK